MAVFGRQVVVLLVVLEHCVPQGYFYLIGIGSDQLDVQNCIGSPPADTQPLFLLQLHDLLVPLEFRVLGQDLEVPNTLSELPTRLRH